MKICPQCDATYHDDGLNFCLMDGTPLAAGESQPTVVIATGAQQTSPMRPAENETFVLPYSARETVVVKPRRSFGFWIGVVFATLATIICASIGGMFLYFFFTLDNDQARQGNSGAKSMPTPRSSPPRSPTPKSPQPSTSPVTSPSESYEITEISWDTTAVVYSGDDGKVYEFECPENGTAAAVWGSAAYTDDSSICTAAVHSGVITIEDGGYVVIQFRPGRETYGSSTRNGITTLSFGKAERSFVIGKKVSGT